MTDDSKLLKESSLIRYGLRVGDGGPSGVAKIDSRGFCKGRGRRDGETRRRHGEDAGGVRREDRFRARTLGASPAQVGVIIATTKTGKS